MTQPLKRYTGVGSRKTPGEVLAYFVKVSAFLAEKGFTLRSGHAEGADLAFETGCDSVRGSKEIYVPWKRFNGSDSDLTPTQVAFTKAKALHPAWEKLARGGRALHARNCHQVLGVSLLAKSDFLICWTLGGAATGGTRTAIVLAEENGVPIYNLGSKNGAAALDAFLGGL